MRRNGKELDEKSLSNWKLLDRFRELLAQARRAHPEPPARVGGPERKLLEDDYFSLLLFGLLNPVVESMRGLCAASALERVQRDICGRPVSLGSFSEAQAVFDPDLLREVFEEMAAGAATARTDGPLGAMAGRLALVDGTLLPALPRMHWALWVDDNNRAAKMHLKFKVLGATPAKALVTAGNGCERAALRKLFEPGEIAVGDRGYSLRYADMGELRELGVSFVLRVRSDAIYEVAEEMPVTEAAKAAGVVWQGKARLGSQWEGEPVRLVRVQADGHDILLATDLEIDADLLALIYRCRWQIELFFKWLKCILGCRHLLAESPRGVAIQVYCALIAALLLASLTGRRPTKRQMEAVQFFLMGYADEDELLRLLKIAKNPA